jgi:hypothetical protein
MIFQSSWFVLQTILIVLACRWIAKTSQKIAWLVVIGVVIRLTSGLGLLAASYFDVSVLRDFHTGDGFWSLAPDARVYFRLASQAAANGVFSVAGGSPSPYFVATLGAWFSAFGTSLIAAISFNVTCYVLTVLAVTAAVRWPSNEGTASDPWWTPGVLIVAGFTFSPLLVLSSTQPLKDPFFAMLMVVGCVGAFKTLTWMTNRPPLGASLFLAGLAMMLIAIGGIAGTRAYYGVLFWLAYAAGFIMALSVGAARRRARVVPVGIAVLVLMWIVLRIGAGPYYDAYRGMAATAVSRSVGVITGLPFGEDDSADLAGTIITFRRGFVRSAGATNLAVSGIITTPLAIMRDTAVGVAATLFPISALQALSVVDIRGGGRGLTWFTDVDTLFLEAILIASLLLLRRNRVPFRQSAATAVFLIMLSVTTGLLAAYIVTNFGTLFRLRLLAIVPAVLLPLTNCRAAGDAERNVEQQNGNRVTEKTLWLKRLA